MVLQWALGEIPDTCYVRSLTPAVGDPELAASGCLPIVKDRERIKSAIRDWVVVGLQAATGSGKTMKVPEFLFQVVNDSAEYQRNPRPVLVVQKALFVYKSQYTFGV